MTATKQRPELLIEVFTDVICPWCWCGEAQLQRTLQSDDFRTKVAPYMRANVKIRPYLLDTRLPATSFDPPSDCYDAIETTDYQKNKPPTKREYYSKKFTSLDAFDAKISKAAAEVDLPPFEWLTDGKVGATWLAHRLLWYALQRQEEQQQQQADHGDLGHTPGIQERLVMRLYRAYHHESQDMSSADVLAELAIEVGGMFADKDAALAWLTTSSDGTYEVKQALDMAQMNGVQSVPFTILQDGADHSSQVLKHDDLMRMFEMQVSMHK